MQRAAARAIFRVLTPKSYTIMNQRREAGMAVCNAPLPKKESKQPQQIIFSAIKQANGVASMLAQIAANCDYLGINCNAKLNEIDIMYRLSSILGELNAINYHIMQHRSI